MFATRTIAILVTAVMGLTGAAPARSPAQDRPDLTGAWTLNPALTAQAGLRSAEDRATIAGRRAPVGSGGPVGMGSGRGPGGMGGGSGTTRQSPEDLSKTREAMRLAMLTPEKMTIARSPQGFVVTEADGVSHTWTADGKTVKSQAGALTIETKVKWDGPVLVVERKFEGDVKATDRYSISGEPRRLTVASKIESNKLPEARSRTSQRVYDAQPAGSINP